MGDVGLVTIGIALLLGLAIWKGSTSIIRALATPPPEIDPDDTVAVNQDYRCSVCGTEVTLRLANLAEASPPKHCREEMVPVWRP
jgi:hypothetical protein